MALQFKGGKASEVDSLNFGAAKRMQEDAKAAADAAWNSIDRARDEVSKIRDRFTSMGLTNDAATLDAMKKLLDAQNAVSAARSALFRIVKRG